VIGGGPAGAASAILLARKGWEVLLLDRARFPRNKPCGEFLTPGAERILHSLGVWETLQEQGIHPVHRLRIHTKHRIALYHAPEDNQLVGWTMRRKNLDAILLDRARSVGVEVKESVTFRSLIRESGHVRGVLATEQYNIGSAWRSRLVIGADGSRSKVAREMEVVKPVRRLQRLAIVTHWRDLDLECGLEMRSSGSVVCGAGALADHSVNLTLVVPMKESSQIAGRAAEYFQDQIDRHFPDLAEKLPTSRREPDLLTTNCFGHYCRRTTDSGVMLVGDAATFIDPFTGEGVYYALRGAELAAETAHQALSAGDTSADCLLHYNQARNELMWRYLLCGLVQGIVRTPTLMNLAVRRLNRHPGLRERLFQVLGDIESPSRTLHPGYFLRLLLPI
jgi:2-polyprenyl-6-methoxyphenol hydroxylase-like FAD-dependent oxidoreductase